MVRCSVLGCKSDSEKKISGLSFHSFPTKPESRVLWLKVTKRNNWVPKKSHKICSLHFHSSSFMKVGKKTYLSPEAIPVEVELPHPRQATTYQYSDIEPLPSTSACNSVPSASGNELTPRKRKMVELPHPRQATTYRYRDIEPLPSTSACNSVPSASGNELTPRKRKLEETKKIIANVCHYFEQEYEELKQKYKGLDLSPLSRCHQRTALAVGVSEQTVVEILKEAARRNDEIRLKQEQSRRKRRKGPDGLSEEDSVDNNGEGEEDEEQSSTFHDEEPEIELGLLDVKNEPGVSGDKKLADPISLEIKDEPQNEELTTSNETLAASKTQQNSEAPPAPFGSPAPLRQKLLFLEDFEVKVEKLEIEEEVFSY